MPSPAPVQRVAAGERHRHVESPPLSAQRAPRGAQHLMALQPTAGNGAVTALVRNRVNAAVRSQGRPLDPPTRAALEARFGADLGHVRIHTDSGAATSACALHARAYTLGRDIVFGAGQYAPASREGRRLLAHEIAHTIQSRGTAWSDAVRITERGEAAEREAVGAAAQVSAGEAVTIRGTAAPGVVLRQDSEDVEEAFAEYTPPPGQVTRAPLAEPLSPEEMYRTLTSRTAFREGVKEQRLLRHGNATRAVLQIIDRDGNRVAIEFGRNDGKVHAEEDAIRRVRRQVAGLEDRLRGGRVVVVVNQHVCSGRCVPALRAFAEEFGMEGVDSHVFVRRAVRGQRRVRPRRAFTTQTDPSTEGLNVERVDEPIYRRPPGGGPGAGGGSQPPGGAAGAPAAKVKPAAGKEVQVRAPPSGGRQRIIKEQGEASTRRRQQVEMGRGGTSTGVGQRLGTRLRGAVRGLRTRFRARIRGTGGRGIGVLIGLVAGLIQSRAMASYEQRQYEGYANAIDARIEASLPRLEQEAVALWVRDEGKPVYASVSITEENIDYMSGYGESAEIETMLGGLTLDYLRIGTEAIAPPDRPRRSYRSAGSIWGAGVSNFETEEYSIPIDVGELLSRADVHAWMAELDRALTDAGAPGLQLQYLSTERNLLQELAGVYDKAASASGEDLGRLGGRIIELHERVAAVAAAQEAILPGPSYTRGMARDINESLGTGVVPDVETQMLEEERTAVQAAAETEEELSSQSLLAAEVEAKSERLAAQRARASRAAARRARQATSPVDARRRAAENEEELSRTSFTAVELARRNTERDLLVEIARMDEELSLQSLPEDELRERLERRDQLLEELAAL